MVRNYLYSNVKSLLNRTLFTRARKRASLKQAVLKDSVPALLALQAHALRPLLDFCLTRKKKRQPQAAFFISVIFDKHMTDLIFKIPPFFFFSRWPTVRVLSIYMAFHGLTFAHDV